MCNGISKVTQIFEGNASRDGLYQNEIVQEANSNVVEDAVLQESDFDSQHM